ncbi:hypothetical protein [Stappia indica]|uniref:hypothetical protein n=1 Tax=Stappia indica TaxID=538381 RepID=UPI00082D6C05|nr:hypothetical protein [Stappia indica]
MTDASSRSADDRPMIEWVVGCFSALLVACVGGFLAYEAAFGEATPPALAASIGRIERERSGTVVEVLVRNDGDRTAAGVVVQVATTGVDGRQVRKTIRFDYVPGHGTRRGAFLLEGAELSQADMQLSIDGFTEP